MSLEESVQSLERGDEAPGFELRGTDGMEYSLEDFDEYEALLIVFTCNHCPYAQAKVEEMKRLHEEYDELAVVGINPNDSEEYPEDSFEEMKAFVREHGIGYFYLRDEDQQTAHDYGAVCTPDPFLFENTAEGFRLVYHGRLDDALNPDDTPSVFYMEQAFESVLAGEDVGFDFMPSQGCSIKWTG